jgi:transketolase
MPIGDIAGLRPAGQLRNAFGSALLEVCRQNPRVVVLDGDLGNSTGAHSMKQEFPDRFYNLGIAESNLVSVAGGFAACGYIPFVTSLTCFLLGNAFDQIRVTIALAGLNAKLVGSHSGLSTNREGPSSMSIEDFALAGALPTFTILVPCDPASMRQAVLKATEHVGPVFIRSSREPMPHVYAADACPFEIGRANVLRPGQDVTLIACGVMVALALDAAVLLERAGIQARVVDMHTLRPLDRAAIEAAARETGAIVTAEEHLIRGGLGSVVAQVAAETCPVPMRFIGMDDTYSVSGSTEELLHKYHMTAADIAAAARAAMAARDGARQPVHAGAPA